MLKIDIHTHILPKNWQNLKEKYGYGGFIELEHHGPGCARMLQDGELFREIQTNCWDPGTRLAECDSAGIDVQVLSTVPVMFSYWAKPEDAADLSRLLNDDLAGVVASNTSRFVGLGTLPMQSSHHAIRELERCVNELGFSGVQIGSHVNHWNLDDEKVFEVFQAAEELGAAVFVHPWEVMGRENMPKYWLQWLVGMPAETSLAICSMLFGGVFEKLPKLRVAFAHGGGSFPATFGRIEHGFKMRPDLCAVDMKGKPRDFLGQFYLDSLVHDQKMLTYLLDLVGADYVALGSDYPFPLGEQSPGELIESMNLDPETRSLLLHGSALNWLGLKKEQFE